MNHYHVDISSSRGYIIIMMTGTKQQEKSDKMSKREIDKNTKDGERAVSLD